MHWLMFNLRRFNLVNVFQSKEMHLPQQRQGVHLILLFCLVCLAAPIFAGLLSYFFMHFWLFYLFNSIVFFIVIFHAFFVSFILFYCLPCNSNICRFFIMLWLFYFFGYDYRGFKNFNENVDADLSFKSQYFSINLAKASFICITRFITHSTFLHIIR